VFRAGNNKQLCSGIPKTRTDANLPHVSNSAAERSLDCDLIGGITAKGRKSEGSQGHLGSSSQDSKARFRNGVDVCGRLRGGPWDLVSEGAAEPSLIAPTTAACNFFIDVHGVDIYSFKDALI
jgi:hypothetical protein